MILSIKSDLASFKPLVFNDGLNILLSDKSEGASDQQTRNSAGKSSFVEIVQFLMGASANKDSLLRHPELEEYSFTGQFKIAGQIIEATRSGSDAGKIFISESDAAKINLETKTTKDGASYASNDAWKSTLGKHMFGLSKTSGSHKNSASFRSLFAYFARRNAAGGYSSPQKTWRNESKGSYQVNLSYLFGLDWRIPADLESVRQRESQLKELRKASKDGAFEQFVGAVSELRPKLALANQRVTNLRREISNFEVAAAYSEMSGEAASARREMLKIELEAVALKESLLQLEKALDQEVQTVDSNVKRVYNAIGIQLPNLALRRYEEVAQFHASIVNNRKAYIEGEIAEAQAKLANSTERLELLDRRRSEILTFLDGKGALEDFTVLQSKLAKHEAEAQALSQRFEAATVLEGQTAELGVDRASITQRLQADHAARKERIDEMILVIANLIGTLYDDRQGEFQVRVTKNGPEFAVSIEGDRGGGIANMEIFCLDIALLVSVAMHFGGPGFLIHDSHLFDPVDERQIASAISLGADYAAASNSQYIVALNSDVFERLPSSKTQNWEDAVLSSRLSDDEAGGIFGFRFD